MLAGDGDMDVESPADQVFFMTNATDIAIAPRSRTLASVETFTRTPSDEIVFIDARVDQVRLLDECVMRAAEVVLVDEHRSGVQQVTEILQDRCDVRSIHLVTHGTDEQVRFGSDDLGAAAVDQHADSLRTWGDALSPDADLRVYGSETKCGTTESRFLCRLTELTGADVAAGTNLTRSAASFGGNRPVDSVATIESSSVFGRAASDSRQSRLSPPAEKHRLPLEPGSGIDRSSSRGLTALPAATQEIVPNDADTLPTKSIEFGTRQDHEAVAPAFRMEPSNVDDGESAGPNILPGQPQASDPIPRPCKLLTWTNFDVDGNPVGTDAAAFGAVLLVDNQIADDGYLYCINVLNTAIEAS